MALGGPNFTNALSAGFQGQDLAETMRQRALQTQIIQQQMRDAEQKRQAQELVGRVLQKVMGAAGQGSALPLPVNGNASPGPPGTIPTPERGAPGGAPALPNVLAPLQGGQPDMAAQMRQRALQPPAQAAPRVPGGVVDGAPELSGPALTWPSIIETLRQVAPDAPPQLVAEVVNGMAPMVAASQKEQYDRWKAEQDLTLKDATRLDNLFKLSSNLDLQYARLEATKASDAAKIALRERMANINLQIQEMLESGRNKRNTENIAGRITTTNLTNQNKLNLAQLNNDAKARISDNMLALKKELESRGLDLKSEALDLKADEIAKTMLYRERLLDLKEKGLDQSHAEALAKLEVTKTLAQMRDATTQRGQDLMHEDRVAAESGRNTRASATLDAKQRALQLKALPALDGATSDLDAIADKAEYLLTHPGLDDATGPIEARLPTFKEQTANFEADLESLKSNLGFAALQNMRQLSPTGGALGNVSNYEVKTLQAKIASLVLPQGGDNMRKNLLEIINYASGAKTRLLKAYDQQYGGGKGAPAPSGVPANLQDKPNGAVITVPATVEAGALKQIDGKWYRAKGDGTAVEQQP
jgi:uncharacterized lipoprotein YehR (DUF1307 family)